MSKVYLLFLLFTAFFSASFCQNCNINSDTNVIKELLFPYKNNLIMIYSSKQIVYDKYNFPSKTTNGFYTYKFHSFKKDIFKVDFLIINNNNKDTIISNSYLSLNDKGLFWWIKEDTIKYKTLRKCKAISLPITNGCSWSTYINNEKAKIISTTIDTTISTPLGMINTFMIHTKTRQHKRNKTKSYFEIEEFYSQDYGKVCSKITQYLITNNSEKKYILNKVESYLIEVKY